MVDKLEKKIITQVFAKKCVFKYKWKFLQPLKLYMRSQSAKHFVTLGNDTISRSEIVITATMIQFREAKLWSLFIIFKVLKFIGLLSTLIDLG